MKIGFEPIMAVNYLAVSVVAVYCIDIGIDCPIIAMVRFQYPKNSEVLSINDLNRWSALLAVLN